MRRFLESAILDDRTGKITMISGPRQSGKTTLARSLPGSQDYLNFDQVMHRRILMEQSWDRKKDWLVLDEIHKMRNWKGWLKGVFDTRETDERIVVTGSASLDVHKKTGESMAGRFFGYRLHPFDVREVVWADSKITAEEAVSRIMRFGGFPEPFIHHSDSFYGRWRLSHLDVILRTDLMQLENIRDIVAVETLVELLRNRVAAPLSYKALSEDLQKDDKTIKRWLRVLESLYVVFRVPPYHKNVARAQLKAPKYYFYDVAQVAEDNIGARFENLVACALLKRCHEYTDVEGSPHELFYLRDREKNEVDFLIVRKNKPYLLVEAKSNGDTLSPAAPKFKKYFPTVPFVQLSLKPVREKTWPGGFELRNASDWLAKMF